MVTAVITTFKKRGQFLTKIYPTIISGRKRISTAIARTNPYLYIVIKNILKNYNTDN